MQTHWEKFDFIFKKSLVEKDISAYAKTLCLYRISKIFPHVGVDVQLKSYFETHYTSLLSVFKEIDNVARDERIRVSLRNFIGEKLQRELGLDIELPLGDRHYYRLDEGWLKAPLESEDPLGYLFGSEEQGGYNYKSQLDRIMAQDPATFSEIKYATHLLRFSLPVLSRRLAQRYIRHENKAKEAEQFFTAIQLSEQLIHTLLLHQNALQDTDKKLILRFYEACFICQKELVLPIKEESDFLQRLLLMKDQYLLGSVLKQQHLAILLDLWMKYQNGVVLTETAQALILEIFAEKMVATEASSFYGDALQLLEKSRAYFLVPQAVLKAQILNHQAIKTLLNHFFMQATILLGGLPPCALSLLLLGSSSRRDRLPYSDVEMALLYADVSTSENLELKQLEINHFVVALLALLELQIIYLGESRAEKQGFWLDSSTSFRNDAYLRNSPSYVIQALYEKEKDTKEWKFFTREKNSRGLKMHSFLYDPSAYSLIQTDCVNTNDDGLLLFANYQTQLKIYLDKADGALLAAFTDLLDTKIDISKVALKKRETIALWVWWDVLRCIEDHIDPSAKTIDLKKVLHKPIAYLVLGMRLYYAFPSEEAASLEAILIMGVNRQVLSVALGDFLLKMLEWVISQRVALHLQHQKQVETLDVGSLDSWMQHRICHLVAMFKLFEKAMAFGFVGLPQKVYGLALDTLISDYLLDSLQQCQTEEQYQQWFITINLYLLYTKALLETHRYYYRQLPALQRESCLRVAEQYFENKVDKACWRHEGEFWAQLWDAPLPDGRRRKHISGKQRWEHQLTSFFSQPGRGIPKLAVNITYLNGKKYALPTSIVHEFLVEQWIDICGKFIDKKKHPIAKDMPGNHLVIAWPKDNPQLYLKVYPEYPLVELFLNELTSRLGYFESREVDLWLWESGEYSYPVLVSQAVLGKSLQAMLTDDLPLSLNSYSFSQSMMLSTLTSQEDGKPDNSIVFYDEKVGYRLCAIDADRWFAPTFKKNLLHAKDIIFCLSNMSDALDPVFREDFLCLNPQQILQAWVKRLGELGEQCIQVFGERIETYLGGLMRADDRKTLLLPPLKFHAVQELFHQMQLLQDLFSNASAQRLKLTHWQVLSCFNSRQANHYLLAHEKHKRALERFEYAAGHAYTRGKGNQQEYFTSKIDFKTQMQDMWEGLATEKEIRLNWERDIRLAREQLIGLMEGSQKIKEAQVELEKCNLTRFKNLSQSSQEKLLSLLDWQVLPRSHQRVVLNFMVTQGHWLNIIIKNSQEVNDSDLERLLQKSPSLKRLVLMSTHQISEAIWEALPQNDALLQALYLENLPNMKSIGHLGKFLRLEKILTLPNLQELSIMTTGISSHLEEINIDAPLLKKLKIHISFTPSVLYVSEFPVRFPVEQMPLDLKVLQTRSQRLEEIQVKTWGKFKNWHLIVLDNFTHHLTVFHCEYVFLENNQKSDNNILKDILLLISQCPVLLAVAWKNYSHAMLRNSLPQFKKILSDINYSLLTVKNRQALLKTIKSLLITYALYENYLWHIQQSLEKNSDDNAFHENKLQIHLSYYQVKLKILLNQVDILKHLQGDDIELKIQAAAALEYWAVTELFKLNTLLVEILSLKDVDPELSIQVATVLLKSDPASTMAHNCLIEGLTDKDPLLRIRAARGLQFSKHISLEIIQALDQALEDKDAYAVRIQAAETLTIMHQYLKEATQQLFHELKETTLKHFTKPEKSSTVMTSYHPRDGIFSVEAQKTFRAPLPDPRINHPPLPNRTTQQPKGP